VSVPQSVGGFDSVKSGGRQLVLATTGRKLFNGGVSRLISAFCLLNAGKFHLREGEGHLS
jgi:hypothetical protein